jgi:hypothetical protein
MEKIQKLHGVPKIIVSDKDLIFTINFWNELFFIWVLNWLTTHLITLNPMGKLRL